MPNGPDQIASRSRVCSTPLHFWDRPQRRRGPGVSIARCPSSRAEGVKVGRKGSLVRLSWQAFRNPQRRISDDLRG